MANGHEEDNYLVKTMVLIENQLKKSSYAINITEENDIPWGQHIDIIKLPDDGFPYLQMTAYTLDGFDYRCQEDTDKHFNMSVNGHMKVDKNDTESSFNEKTKKVQKQLMDFAIETVGNIMELNVEYKLKKSIDPNDPNPPTTIEFPEGFIMVKPLSEILFDLAFTRGIGSFVFCFTVQYIRVDTQG